MTAARSRPPAVAASLLAADIARLGAEVEAVAAAGAARIHIDAMDNHFVPNLAFGPDTMAALRPVSDLPFDVHLEVAPAEPFIAPFAEAGADSITVHAEAGPHLHRSLQRIRALGLKAGAAINPATPVGALDAVLDLLDLIVVMSVTPGFGGQTYLPLAEPKLTALRARLGETGHDVALAVDGGIDARTAPGAVAAGADVLIAGSAVFAGGPARYGTNIAALRGA